uniref:Thyroglobulin type-1 domain-containing protein n=1 Tax=Periophthalmus magnuspinnatus TaxID=409849 RepID=A0A3B3ZZ90_9GOBI
VMTLTYQSHIILFSDLCYNVCLSTDATARPKSHCEHHRDKIQTQGRPLIGAYVPQCDADGEYSAEQCHGSTGYCWCVDANGREHQGTKTPPGADRAECTTKGT